jgi:peptide/nickel transport system substrate-binding protein
MGRDIPADQAIALKESGQFEFTVSPPALGYSILSFPTTGQQNVKALADPRVRLAIIKAIDRKDLLVAQYGDLGKTMTPHPGLCSKEQLGCGYTREVPDHDPAGAKKLLAQAGYPDGFAVTIAASTPNEATAVAGMLRQVGIRATLRMTTLAQRVQALSQGRIEIGLFGWSGGGMFEVSSQIVRHFLSNEYDDAVLAKMAADTNTMMNDAERRKAVAKVMDYANENAYAFPVTPIRVIFVHTQDVRLLATDVRAGQVQPHEFGWK